VIVTRGENGAIENVTSSLFGEQFVLHGDPTRCRRLEYRQYVRSGPATIRKPNGEELSISVPTDWLKAGSQWEKVSRHSAELWIEDTRAVDPAPTIWRYGHRDDKKTVPPDEFDTSEYEGDFVYRGFDRCRIVLPALTPSGSRVLITSEFKGQIVDSCTGKLVVESPTWRWRVDVT